MYLDFYKLKKEPFQVTPDPEFIYLSPSHKEALASIIYGVEQKKGFVELVGEVGVGKTTVLRYYLDSADRKWLKTIYVFHPNLTFRGLLKFVLQELEVPAIPDDVEEMIQRLQQVLIEEYKNGNTVVLVIDEAQNAPLDTLENLRMLTNLETSTDKLLQIVLCGQPELDRLLQQKELRQLRQRVAVRATITRLTRAESVEYIRHRLARSARGNAAVFSDRAIDRIVRQAKGVPRTINILCDNALIAGFGYQERKVRLGTAKKVIAAMDGEKAPTRMIRRVAAGLLFLLLAGGYVGYRMYTPAVRNPIVVRLNDRNTPPQPLPRDEVFVKFEEPVALTSAGTSAIEVSATPAPEETKPEVAEETFPVTRVVRKGDSLGKLVEDVYGVSNQEILRQVQEKNETIKDINKIQSGNRIVFPGLDR